MFPTVLRQEQMRFTNTPANDLFPNINGRAFRGDCTFIATLRALLKDRVPQDRNVHVSLNETTSLRPNGYADAKDLLTHALGHVPYEDEIAIINFRQRGERAEETAKMFDRLLADACGFALKADLGMIIEQSKQLERCRFYVSLDGRSCIIAVNELSMPIWHALQCTIPRAIPAYFTNPKLTDEEKALIFALNKPTEDEYLSLIEKMAEGVDFRGHMIRSIVSGVMTRAAENNIAALNESIATARRRAEESLNEYSSMMRQIDRDSATLAGYIIRKNAGNNDEELLNFLSAMTWFTPLQKQREGFSFIVHTFLDMFDPDMFETMADNEDSHIWDAGCGDHFASRSDRRLLLDALFGHDAKFKVNCSAYFRIDTRGSVYSGSDFNHGAPEMQNDLMNPHLYNYNCFGDHYSLIAKCITDGDLMGAVMQCKTSASSINVGEPPTMRNLVECLFTTDKKCIHLPDGRDVTPYEALMILKEGSDA